MAIENDLLDQLLAGRANHQADLCKQAPLLFAPEREGNSNREHCDL